MAAQIVTMYSEWGDRIPPPSPAVNVRPANCNTSDIREFVKRPAPQGHKVYCHIERRSVGSGIYHMYLEDYVKGEKVGTLGASETHVRARARARARARVRVRKRTRDGVG